MLPLGISFYTFEQITYLVDVYRGTVPTRSLIHYGLFTLFFPHLMAGPILRPKETIPQFSALDLSAPTFNAGAFLMALGLFKKLALADHFAPAVDQVYSVPGPLTFWQSLTAIVAYSLQIYFDFSGYSDMALGLGGMFGIHLPVNFNSPYKSASLTEFWQRWHISLSLFFRDYLYIPLGGNRRGRFRQYANLLVTMFLCGLWHGASWTFVLWGGLHGVGLTVSHVLRRWRPQPDWRLRPLKIAVTFSLVSLAWVIFRAPDLAVASRIYAGLGQWPGTDRPTDYLLLVGIVLLAFPNSNQLAARVRNLRMADILYPQQLLYRSAAYVLVGTIVIGALMKAFYEHGADFAVYRTLPLVKDDNYIQNDSGDYRSNVFNKSIFGDRNVYRSIIIGSSFTVLWSNYQFTYGDKPYESVSLGMNGNSILNGFRTAFAIVPKDAVDTLVFGLSPINILSFTLNDLEIPWPDQCTQPFMQLGMGIAVDPALLTSCGPMNFSLRNFSDYLFAPKQPQYGAFNVFLRTVLSDWSWPFYRAGFDKLDLSKDGRAAIDADVASAWQAPIIPVQHPKLGAEQDDHWSEHDPAAILAPGGTMFEAFKSLALLCRQHGVRLIIYTSPTPRHELAPDNYPPGYLGKFNQAAAATAAVIGAEFYDFSGLYPWQGAYMDDFVHPTSQGRKLLHRVIIEHAFPPLKAVVNAQK